MTVVGKLSFVIAFVCSMPVHVFAADLSIRAGSAVLSITTASNLRYGVQITNSRVTYGQPHPVILDIVSDTGEQTTITDGYEHVAIVDGSIQCDAVVTTPHGTQFRVVDRYAPAMDLSAFTLDRTVTIASPSTSDAGFNSEFQLYPTAPTMASDVDTFVPGIVYGRSTQTPPRALFASAESVNLIREDRLPLPLTLQRNEHSGATVLLAHLDGNPATFVGENGRTRLIDARMQFGAIGAINTQSPSPTFVFPGNEGARTYVRGPGPTLGWAYRSHPVQVDVPHSYRLLLQVDKTDSFSFAVREAWRTVYKLQQPPTLHADMAKIYRDSMSLLAAISHPYDGTISVPFAAVVPDGKVVDTSSQMGFVGQALPVAALLLRYGYEANDSATIAHANAVVDFWVKNCLSVRGVPRTWYDIHPDGNVSWRNYHTFLRVASDGVDGALQAWNIARDHGLDHPDWLAFCRTYGDWLTGVQNADGSFAREYGFDGKVLNPATDTTDQVIPFLVDLYLATGNERYADVARRAGKFCLQSVDKAYAYVGGTPDNPNVTDKEGGMMALAAFLALHDLTGDRHYLQAAIQAADYSETWVYCWNVPIPAGDDLGIVYPRHRTTFGASLIATGHSGADEYMAAAPFYYYRLYVATGDTHFRDVARMLLYDTKQMMDWDGSMGYAYPGLMTEAFTLSSPRGHGQTHYLPWLTVAVLEPLVRLQDVFGSMDIGPTDLTSRAALAKRNADFGLMRGFNIKDRKH